MNLIHTRALLVVKTVADVLKPLILGESIFFLIDIKRGVRGKPFSKVYSSVLL